MFEKSLEDKLKKIFDLDKVTYDRPSESQEQEAVFIQVENANCRVKDGRQLARVTGTLRVFARSEHLPYGYFAKKISEADASLTKNFFFYDFEENAGTYRDIVERSLGFLFLFDSQHDPEMGEIN